jgi:hypothetical protein
MTSMHPNIRYDAAPAAYNPTSQPPQYRVLWPLILAKTQLGTVEHVYEGGTIPWLPQEQATMLLEYGAIERIGTSNEPTQITNDCIATLDQLDLPADCGSPTARIALRKAGHHFSNTTIADAVKFRKANPPKGSQA